MCEIKYTFIKSPVLCAIAMEYEPSEIERILYKAIWDAVPEGQYRDDTLELGDVRHNETIGSKYKLTAIGQPNQSFKQNKFYYSTVDGEEVRFKLVKCHMVDCQYQMSILS